MQKLLKVFLGLSIVVNLYACGTILYPERKGQTSGRLDVGVVLLNSVGLLLYFIPGVIAFAVDFSNGTIYLPGGSATTLDDDQLERLARGDMDAVQLQHMLSEKGLLPAAANAAHGKLKLVRLAQSDI